MDGAAAGSAKYSGGYFFEDYRPGMLLDHATPRTLTEGDRALYTALYPSRFALASADSFAQGCGLPESPMGHFELNVFKPMMIYNLLQSMQLLGDAA
ncbi:MAG: hypothetical protein AAFU72_14800, partial [Pseudomonadota bacterium]